MDELTLSQAKFIGCRSVEDAVWNGAIWIDITPSPKKSGDDEEGETTPGSFQLVNLHFRGCAAGETQNDDEGQPSEVQQRNIDICGVGVAEYLRPSALNAESSISFDGAITKYANTDESAFWVEDTSATETSELSASLLHFLFPPPSSSAEEEMSIHVAADGVETEACGWSDLPCRVIGAAVEHSGAHTAISLHSGAHTHQTHPPSLSLLTTHSVEIRSAMERAAQSKRCQLHQTLSSSSRKLHSSHSDESSSDGWAKTQRC